MFLPNPSPKRYVVFEWPHMKNTIGASILQLLRKVVNIKIHKTHPLHITGHITHYTNAIAML